MSTVFEAAEESPAAVLIRAMRRSWRVVETDLARAPRESFAPAATVARAVGMLALEAATHGAGNAAPGAVAGCSEGMARAVDVALARLVLDALPGRAASQVDAGRVTTREPRESGDGRWPERHRGRLPAAGWWGREAAWSPRIAGEAPEAGGLGPLWPRVPESGGTRERRARVTNGPASERRLLDLAWHTLEQELEPSPNRRGAAGGGR